MKKNTPLRDLLFLFPLSAFFLLFQLGRGSLASWDEALYAAVAKEAVRSGDWLHFTLGGRPWVDKPPLAIWTTAIFFKWFGVQEFSARLFSALCGVGAVLVTYFLGRQLFNRWTGLVSALVLLSSSHFIRFARFGMMDAPLAFFLSLSLYFFWLGRYRNRYMIFSGIALGAAVMTKGFAAFLVLPVMGLYCLFAGELDVFGRSSYWIGLMIAVFIALPWHLYALLANHDAFVRDMMIKHLFVRTTTALDGHTGRLDFYLRVMVNKYHPWIVVGIFSAPFFLFKAIRERSEEAIFISAWIFLILAVITVIRTKLGWYVLPVYPALSITVGYVLANTFRERYALFVKAGFILVLGVHAFYSHIWNQDYSHFLKGIAPVVGQVVPKDKVVYLYNFHESPAAYFYLERDNAYLDDVPSFLAKAREMRGNFFCLIGENELKAIWTSPAELGLEVKGSYEGAVLLASKRGF